MSYAASLLLVSGVALVTCAFAMALTAVVARRSNRVSVVDVTWGFACVAVATISAVIGAAADQGDPVRRWLLVGLVAGWGLRLSIHIGSRAVAPVSRGGHGGAEDPRYAELLGVEVGERFAMRAAVRRVFLIQGLAVWLVTLPAQAAAVSDVAGPVGAAVLGLGVVVILIGCGFEAVGDAQLAAFKRIPAPHRPGVLDSGLWGRTRHPNYFGDACVAWGAWLVGGAASGWQVGLATVIAPMAMTYFLVYATGAMLLERTLIERPGYREYAARTPMFVPRLLPRRAA